MQTYAGERGQAGEVLQGVKLADVEADHLEQAELLQVVLVFG